jgi:hypothetical protein
VAVALTEIDAEKPDALLITGGLAHNVRPIVMQFRREETTSHDCGFGMGAQDRTLPSTSTLLSTVFRSHADGVAKFELVVNHS